MKVEAPTSKIHNQDMTDPGEGEHLWIVSAIFKVSQVTIETLNRGEDPGAVNLDHENLLTIEGPGCWKCEEKYSKRMSFRRCTGSMDLQ